MGSESVQSNAQGVASSVQGEHSQSEKENSDPNFPSVNSRPEKSVGSRHSFRQSTFRRSDEQNARKGPIPTTLGQDTKLLPVKVPLAERGLIQQTTQEEEDMSQLYATRNRSGSLLARCFGDYEQSTQFSAPAKLESAYRTFEINDKKFVFTIHDKMDSLEYSNQSSSEIQSAKHHRQPPIQLSAHNSYQSCSGDPFRMKEDNAVV